MDYYYKPFTRDGGKYYVKGVPIDNEDGTTFYAVALVKLVGTAWKTVATTSFPDASVVTEDDIWQFVDEYFEGQAV